MNLNEALSIFPRLSQAFSSFREAQPLEQFFRFLELKCLLAEESLEHQAQVDVYESKIRNNIEPLKNHKERLERKSEALLIITCACCRMLETGRMAEMIRHNEDEAERMLNIEEVT
jgi:hypothetical protein